MSFGNCGYAFPTAIGAKVAAPDRPAIAYVGDGAWGMSLQETLTCVRENIPVVAVVFNNGQWGAEKKNQIDYYADRYVGTNLEEPQLRRHRQGDGRGGHHGRAIPARSATRCSRRSARGKPHRPGADADAGAGRSVPPRRAQEAEAAAGQVQGLHRRLTVRERA